LSRQGKQKRLTLGKSIATLVLRQSSTTKEAVGTICNALINKGNIKKWSVSAMQPFGHKLAQCLLCKSAAPPGERCTIRKERRRFDRLPLAIPLFLRGVDKNGKEFLDFTVTLNVSAGGALVASRRSLARACRVSLEVPTAPIPPLAVSPEIKRAISGRVVRGTNKNTFNLYAVRFVRPLVGKVKLPVPVPGTTGHPRGRQLKAPVG
jgi:hypothetical protein